MRIVMFSDGETWTSVAGVTVHTVTESQQKKLDEGASPKNVGISPSDGIPLQSLLDDLIEYEVKDIPEVASALEKVGRQVKEVDKQVEKILAMRAFL